MQNTVNGRYVPEAENCCSLKPAGRAGIYHDHYMHTSQQNLGKACPAPVVL